MKPVNRRTVLDPRNILKVQRGNSSWLEGQVTLKKVDGWLLIKICGSGDTILIRNSQDLIAKMLDPKLPGPSVTTFARFTRVMFASNEFNSQCVTKKPTETKTLTHNANTLCKVIDSEFGSAAMVLSSIGNPSIENKLIMMIYWLLSSKTRIDNGKESSQIRVNTIDSMFECFIKGLEFIKDV